MTLQEKVRKYLHYNKSTGVFTWRRKSGKARRGDVAGTLANGYIQIQLRGKLYQAQRLAWVYVKGSLPPKGMEIDHENGVRDDNRWCNLKCVEKEVNTKNKVKCPKNTSGHNGISWYAPSKKWRVRIGDKGTIHVGHYDTIEEALNARQKAERKYNYHPNHGRTKEERSLYTSTTEYIPPHNKMKLFYSGSTSGESLPEQALRDVPASIMLTWYEIYEKRGDTKTRFFRHERRRRPNASDQ
jgi:hypothetical protein